MKVLMVNDYRTASGAETHLDDLTSGLALEGVDVETWTPDDYKLGLTLKALKKRFNPDVVHVHNFWRLHQAGQANDLFKTKTPVMLSLHDYALVCPKRMRLFNWRRCSIPCSFECGGIKWVQSNRKLTERALKVTFNEGSAEIFRVHGVNPMVVPHGIDLSKWPFIIGERYGVGFVCGHRSYWWKGYDVALEVARRTNSTFHCIRGGRPREDARRVYQTCKVWVNPCVYDDTFGLTTLEALASGTLVASYDTAGARHLISNPHILVPIGDVDAMTNAVEILLDKSPFSPPSSYCIGQTAFSHKTMARKYKTLYEELERR